MGIAEASLIVSSVAALASVGGAIITYRLGVRRFDHERELADRADARTVLADGGLELGRMKGTLKDALSVFKEPLEGNGDWPVDFPDEIAKVETAADALEAALVRVRIRFEKETRIVKEMIAAHEDVRTLLTRYVQARKRDNAPGGRKEPEKDFEAVWTTSLDYDARVVGYVEAAQCAVGAELGNGG